VRAAAVGTVIAFVVVSRQTIVPAMRSLRNPHWGWLPIAICAEAVSMGAFARMQRKALAQGGLTIPARSAIAITYASNAVSVTVPVGGSTASTAFTVKQFASRGADPALITWALGVCGIISTAAFAIVVGVGGLLRGSGPSAALSGVAAVIGVLPAVVVFVMVRHERGRVIAIRALATVLRFSRRISGRPRGDAAVIAAGGVDRFVSFRLHGRSGVQVWFLAILNWVADGAVLVAAVAFVGQQVPWGSLSLVYAAGIGAATIGVTPAGLGVVETSIAAALGAAGMSSRGALAAALLYRGISCWVVLAIGWAVYAVLRRPTGASALVGSVWLPDQRR
jgi:putative heme transporter